MTIRRNRKPPGTAAHAVDHGNKRGKLTPRQAAFVVAYLACNNAELAARQVGYSAATKYGGRLVVMPLVRAEIEKRRTKLLGKLQLNAEVVLADIHRNAKKAEMVGEFNAAIRGHELLGRHLKLFTEKHELAGAGPNGEHLFTHIQILIVDPRIADARTVDAQCQPSKSPLPELLSR